MICVYGEALTNIIGTNSNSYRFDMRSTSPSLLSSSFPSIAMRMIYEPLAWHENIVYLVDDILRNLTRHEEVRNARVQDRSIAQDIDLRPIDFGHFQRLNDLLILNGDDVEA